jgi:aspartate racemase
MKTLGIIGGLGPETTAHFYMEIISLSAKINKKQRPSILIANVPMDLEVEGNFINHSIGGVKFLKLILESAISLEKGGADFLVMPCNTAHVFIEEIRNAVSIPVLSILDETVKFVEEENNKKVLLLATPSTIKNKLFDEKFTNKNIQILKPNEDDQELIGEIVNRILKNKQSNKDKLELLRIINGFRDIDAVVLACTDLHILISKHRKIKIIDSMQVLAGASVRKIIF